MLKRSLIVALALSLAGCGGGGGGGSVAPAASGTSATNSSAKQNVSLKMRITAGSSASSVRRAQFVSSATAGVQVNVYSHADTTHSTLLGSVATDVSSGSTACGGTTGTRTCQLLIPAPAGNDDFVFITYASPPVSGAFTGLTPLGSGTVTQNIIANQANTISVSVGGQVATITFGSQSTIVFPSDGNTHVLGLTVIAQDASGNVIVGGANDPFVNPITISIPTEHNGSGHVALSANTPCGQNCFGFSITMNYSTQVIFVNYDGKGGPGYYATFNASAAATATTPAVAAVTSTIAGLVATSTSQYLNPGYPPTINFTASGQTATFNVYEWTGASDTFTANGCANIVSTSAPGNPTTDPTLGFNETFTLTSGNTSGACNIAVSDGTVSVPIVANVSVTGQPNTGGQITIPGSGSTSVAFTSTPFNATDAINPQTVTLPALGPVTGATLSLGSGNYACCFSANPIPTTTTLLLSPVAPVGLPALTGTGVNQVIEYAEISTTESLELEPNASPQNTLAFTFSSPPSGQYYLAAYNTTLASPGWWLATLGPGTISGNTVTFTQTTGYPDIYGGSQYTFGLALYQ